MRPVTLVRTLAGLSISGFAKQLDLHRQSVQQFETVAGHRRACSQLAAARILIRFREECEALEIGWPELLEMDQLMKPEHPYHRELRERR